MTLRAPAPGPTPRSASPVTRGALKPVKPPARSTQRRADLRPEEEARELAPTPRRRATKHPTSVNKPRGAGGSRRAAAAAAPIDGDDREWTATRSCRTRCGASEDRGAPRAERSRMTPHPDWPRVASGQPRQTNAPNQAPRSKRRRPGAGVLAARRKVYRGRVAGTTPRR